METDPSPSPVSPLPPTLNYSKRPALAAASRHRGKLIVLALLLAVGVTIWRYRAPLKHRVLWLYWFNQAMAHRMPEKAGDLTYDDPVKAAAAASADPDYLAYTPLQPPAKTIRGANYVPAVYRALVPYDPRLWLTMGDRLPVAFIGTLTRPDGAPRLVVVTGNGGTVQHPLQQVAVLVLAPPTWIDPLPETRSRRAEREFHAGGPLSLIRLRSGIIDPADPSRILFEYTVANRVDGAASAEVPAAGTGMIDARLQNDDSIRFRIGPFSGNDPGIAMPETRMVSTHIPPIEEESLRTIGARLQRDLSNRSRIGQGGRPR